MSALLIRQTTDFPSYNRDLYKQDVLEMIKLIKSGSLQNVVDNYNVRKIYGRDLPLLELLISATESGSADLVKFITDRLSYDDLALCVSKIYRSYQLNQPVKKVIRNIIDDYRYNGDYCELFQLD